MSTTTKRIAGVNALLGLWLIAAPFWLGAPPIDLWNDVIVGILIAGIAGYNWYRKDQEVSRSGAGFNALLGLWLIVGPFLYGVSGVLLWNDVIVGAIVASLAGYAVAYVGEEDASAGTATT